MLRASLDAMRRIIVAAGYSVPLEDAERVVRSPLGARDVARPGQFAALEHHGLENEPPYPVEDDQPGAR